MEKKIPIAVDVRLRKDAASKLSGQRVRFIAEVMPSGQQHAYSVSHIDRNGFIGLEGINGLWSPFILEVTK